jgi:hypothetical protein
LSLDSILAYRDPRLSIVFDEATSTYSLRVSTLIEI